MQYPQKWPLAVPIATEAVPAGAPKGAAPAMRAQDAAGRRMVQQGVEGRCRASRYRGYPPMNFRFPPLFKFSGRIDRPAFLRGHAALLAFFLLTLLNLMAGAILGGYTLVLGIGVLILLTVFFGAVLTVVAFFVGMCALVACRARDVGLSGWSCLLMLVPGLGVAFWLYLAWAPSAQESLRAPAAPAA